VRLFADRGATLDLPLYAANLGPLSDHRVKAIGCMTPLQLAHINGHPEIVALLRERGATIAAEVLPDPGENRGAFFDKLRNAIECNLESYVSAALRLKPELASYVSNYVDDPALIHTAARWGGPGIVHLLAAAGADVDSRDRHGRTPIWLALNAARDVAGRCEVVDALLERGARANGPCGEGGADETPLLWAVYTKNTRAVELLRRHGASPSFMCRTSYFCGTPLQLARSMNQRDVESLLARE